MSIENNTIAKIHFSYYKLECKSTDNTRFLRISENTNTLYERNGNNNGYYGSQPKWTIIEDDKLKKDIKETNSGVLDWDGREYTVSFTSLSSFEEDYAASI